MVAAIHSPMKTGRIQCALLEALEEVLPIVGVWWEDENDLYQFALAKGQDPVVTDIFRHTLKAAILGYLTSKGTT